jgi:hypothetical protein
MPVDAINLMPVTTPGRVSPLASPRESTGLFHLHKPVAAQGRAITKVRNVVANNQRDQGRFKLRPDAPFYLHPFQVYQPPPWFPIPSGQDPSMCFLVRGGNIGLRTRYQPGGSGFQANILSNSGVIGTDGQVFCGNDGYIPPNEQAFPNIYYGAHLFTFDPTIGGVLSLWIEWWEGQYPGGTYPTGVVPPGVGPFAIINSSQQLNSGVQELNPSFQIPLCEINHPFTGIDGSGNPVFNGNGWEFNQYLRDNIYCPYDPTAMRVVPLPPPGGSNPLAWSPNTVYYPGDVIRNGTYTDPSIPHMLLFVGAAGVPNYGLPPTDIEGIANWTMFS